MDAPTPNAASTFTGQKANQPIVHAVEKVALMKQEHPRRFDNNKIKQNVYLLYFVLICMCPCSFLLQRVFYFPLTERLEKLLKIPAYRQALQHEFERPKNAAYMTDVYDCPACMEFMGPATLDLKRIGWLFCVDGIPAFAAGTLSLKPAEFINLSLPPGVRSQSENILLMMLLPSSLAKGQAQKKYYDFAAAFELNDLATTGR